MCSPEIAIASTVLSAISSYSQGKSAASAAKANAAIARQNAETNKVAALDALSRGADEGANQRQLARSANARIRATAGASGILADSGTPLDLQTQNAGYGELNALTAGNNAEREAYGYEVAGVNNLNQANMYDAEAKSAKMKGLLDAGTTLITGAATYGKSMKKPAGFGDTSPNKWASTQGRNILLGRA